MQTRISIKLKSSMLSYTTRVCYSSKIENINLGFLVGLLEKEIQNADFCTRNCIRSVKEWDVSIIITLLFIKEFSQLRSTEG